jgi:hypothetical protein
MRVAGRLCKRLAIRAISAPCLLFGIVNWHRRRREEPWFSGSRAELPPEMRMEAEDVAAIVNPVNLLVNRKIVPPKHYGVAHSPR